MKAENYIVHGLTL